MRLTDLEPKWFTYVDGRTGMGVTFRCPCKSDCTQRLAVWFANPVDGQPPAPVRDGKDCRWQRAGDTFETLTLTPSIDCSGSGHWHGHIHNGEIR